MALMMFLVLFLAMTGSSSAVYCICKDGISEAMLQKALDYACGAGADCTPILQNGNCYNPNTVKSHCDYAVNSYFQRKGQVSGSCDFAGAATTNNVAPAQSSSCVYQSTPSTTSGGTTTPTMAPPTTTTPSTTTPSTTTPSTTTPSTNTPTYIPGTTPSIFNTGLGPSSFTNTDPNAASAQTLHKHLMSVAGLAFLLLQV
ncbi:unnamed protein product [Rhodiola kirilowii]